MSWADDLVQFLAMPVVMGMLQMNLLVLMTRMDLGMILDAMVTSDVRVTGKVAKSFEFGSRELWRKRNRHLLIHTSLIFIVDGDEMDRTES